MKTRDIKELHTKTIEELRTMLKDMKASLGTAQMDHAQRKLTNTTSLAILRADIARVKTVIQMKSTVEKTVVAEGGKA